MTKSGSIVLGILGLYSGSVHGYCWGSVSRELGSKHCFTELLNDTWKQLNTLFSILYVFLWIFFMNEYSKNRGALSEVQEKYKPSLFHPQSKNNKVITELVKFGSLPENYFRFRRTKIITQFSHQLFLGSVDWKRFCTFLTELHEGSLSVTQKFNSLVKWQAVCIFPTKLPVAPRSTKWFRIFTTDLSILSLIIEWFCVNYTTLSAVS